MVLYFVGAGLGDLDDLTIKGRNALSASKKIYLEIYTSIQENLNVEVLAKEFPQAEVIAADRDFVESGCDKMIEESVDLDVSFVVVGDPFGATTHADLYLRARALGGIVEVIHNASIINAVGCTGLQLYRFGQTVSIPFFESSWRPESFVDKIVENVKQDLHTLCLLDIKVKEQSVENMVKRNNIFEPPRFMTVNTAIAQILEVLDKRPGVEGLSRSTLVCGVARVGTKSQIIKFGQLKDLALFDFGRELHSLIICAPTLHEIESHFAKLFDLP